MISNSTAPDAEKDEKIECDECSAEEQISPEYTRESAESDGWYLGATTRRTLCPECNLTGL